jgi:hypothetical protein
MKDYMVKDDKFSSIVERINELDLSLSEKRDAVESLRRGEQIASLLYALGAGMKKFALAASRNLPRQATASASGRGEQSKPNQPRTPALT